MVGTNCPPESLLVLEWLSQFAYFAGWMDWKRMGMNKPSTASLTIETTAL